MSPLAHRSTLLTLALLAAGCTLNVQPVSATATSDTALALTTLRSDLRSVRFGSGSVEARGSDRTGAHAELTILGLLSQGGSPEAIESGVSFVWDASMSPLVTLGVSYDGPSPESLSLERLAIDLPRACAVDLETEDARVIVSELAASVRVRTVSGDIFVSGATDADLGSENGDIEVVADRATVRSGSGEVVLDVGGAADVETEAGAVRGTFANGGSIVTTAGGSIAVELLGPLTRDLELTVESGAIELFVPAHADLDLELAATGSIHVAVGAVTHDGHGTLERRLGAGGFRVIAHADAGAIRIEGR